jgi:hypothetical protein
MHSRRFPFLARLDFVPEGLSLFNCGGNGGLAAQPTRLVPPQIERPVISASLPRNHKQISIVAHWMLPPFFLAAAPAANVLSFSVHSASAAASAGVGSSSIYSLFHSSRSFTGSGMRAT